MNLVLIETSGNQQYIFATNKLRENVGASELTYRVGTQWTFDAIRAAGGPDLWPEDADTFTLRENLLNQPQIESSGGNPVEVVVATSGKALLLVQERTVGKAIIRHVTSKALESAPGIDVCGVISDDFEWNKCSLDEVNRCVHEIFEDVRANRPGPVLRFLRLPVVNECATSGLPAAKWDDLDPNDVGARSDVAIAKRDARSAYKERMRRLLSRRRTQLGFAENVDKLIDKLETEASWLAVIHADGNGLGQVFLEFGRYAACERSEHNRSFVDKLRRFSLALDICTEDAFLDTIDEWVRTDPGVWYRLPILPIVLGGDDMTVVCDGRAALYFTVRFLRRFEERSAQPVGILSKDTDEEKNIIATIIRNRVSVCAGVSIIKPHFPFSTAYDLAEDLIRSAKQVKEFVKHQENGAPWPCSALDFHIHYDTSGTALDQIRARLMVDAGETRLHCRPYVVTPITRLDGTDGKEWAELHHWDELQRRVDALTETDDEGRRQLPNSQMHDLRAGLFHGKAVVDARYKLIRHRYQAEQKTTITAFDGDREETLFELEPRERRPQSSLEQECREIYATKLLDAMDVATLHESKREN